MARPTISRSTPRESDANGPVHEWQRIIGVAADGAFGATTDARTREWQRTHRLVADGVVGPHTWAVALGEPPPKQSAPTATQSVDQWAYEVAKRANTDMGLGLTPAEIQYVLAVARGEGYYGRGWGTKRAMSYQDTSDYQRFGLVGDEGVGSNNWGAIMGTGDAGSFRHLDHHADGTAFVGTYKRYSTPEKGFADMARVILSGGTRKTAGAQAIRSAIAAGDVARAVSEQRANGYFELAADKYLAAVKSNYEVLMRNLDWEALLLDPKARLARPA